jgi:uncharacterized protein involved in exopolysaccharide biosynthesis
MINPAKAYTIDEYIEILHRRKWYIIIPFLVIVIGAGIYSIFAPRQYKASTLVLVSPQRVPEAFIPTTVTSKIEERLQSIAQEVMSRTRLEQIISEMRLYEKEQKSQSKEEVVALMQKDIKIELPSKKDEKGHFSISYIGRDPNTVTTVANRLASLFIARRNGGRGHAIQEALHGPASGAEGYQYQNPRAASESVSESGGEPEGRTGSKALYSETID